MKNELNGFMLCPQDEKCKELNAHLMFNDYYLVLNVYFFVVELVFKIDTNKKKRLHSKAQPIYVFF